MLPLQGSIRDRLDALQRQMAAPGYAERSPAEVQQADAERCQKAPAELAALDSLTREMQALLQDP